MRHPADQTVEQACILGIPAKFSSREGVFMRLPGRIHPHHGAGDQTAARDQEVIEFVPKQQ
jgi:hypothetical protein